MLHDSSPVVEVAAGTGYCDQAHLHRDARTFTHLTPGQFLAAKRLSPTTLDLRPDVGRH